MVVLRDNKVYGSIPEWRGMKKLKYLDLVNNKLSNMLPEKFLVLHRNIEYLYLSQNSKLSGTLPSLPKNSSLKCLDIRGTNIHKFKPAYFSKDAELFLPYRKNMRFMGTTLLENTSTSIGNMLCKICQHGHNDKHYCLLKAGGELRHEKLGYNKRDKYIWCRSINATVCVQKYYFEIWPVVLQDVS